MKILQNILGTKAKVAVLREVSQQPGITARQIAESSDMAWGSIRPAVAQLREACVVRSERGRWANGLYLNEDHVMFYVLTQLFNREAEAFSAFVYKVCEKMMQDSPPAMSVLENREERAVLVVREAKAEEDVHGLERLAAALGITLRFISPEEFNDEVQGRAERYEVAAGERPPFSTIEKGLNFFGLNEEI